MVPMLLAALTLVFVSAPAATVVDLYESLVPTAGVSGPALGEAYRRALGDVLVKVTGRRQAASDPAAAGVLDGAARLVRRYQPAPGGALRVSFDPVALRARLDAANLPVWGDERPTTLVLIRQASGSAAKPGLVVAGDGAAGPRREASPGADADRDTRIRRTLAGVAAARGVGIELPDAATALRADSDAFGRDYLRRRADAAVLIGQASGTGGEGFYTWTLLRGDQREQWPGDLSEGINGLADRFAARDATLASQARRVRVRISGLASFEDYAKLQEYLRGLSVIQSASLQRLSGDSLWYELNVRGDLERLQRELAIRQVLEVLPAPTGLAAEARGDLELRMVLAP